MDLALSRAAFLQRNNDDISNLGHIHQNKLEISFKEIPSMLEVCHTGHFEVAMSDRNENRIDKLSCNKYTFFISS